MIMILDNAYKKQLGRYEFAIKYCSGKTLDYSFASIMSYHGSKILLDNGTEEIFSYDISNNKEELSYRKLDLNKKIVYSNFNETYTHENNSVDSIIFSEIVNEKNITNNKLNYFNKILKFNGVLIISTLNKNNKSLIFDNKSNHNYFSKSEFIELLEKNFSNIELFSQKLISKKDMRYMKFKSFTKLKIKIKFLLSMILSKFDKKSNFYNSYLKNENQDKTQKINAKDYSINPYEKNHNPLFFVAVCHKTNEL